MSSNLKSTFDELEFLVQSKKIKEVKDVKEANLPKKQTASQENIETPVTTNSLRPQVGKNVPIKNPPTEEQEAVINCDADKIKVIALSGAGKTTTLTRYAKKRMKSRGLYVGSVGGTVLGALAYSLQKSGGSLAGTSSFGKNTIETTFITGNKGVKISTYTFSLPDNAKLPIIPSIKIDFNILNQVYTVNQY